MTEQRIINQVGRDYRETHVNDQGIYVEGDYYNSPEQKQNLAESAQEIQELLEQLSKTYPTNTQAGKMKVATEVIETIETNLSLKNRVISAIKAGGISALEQLLNHPAASFVIGALADWNETDN